MDHTNTLMQRARTKIVATVGPACREVEKLVQLIRAGVSVFRINTAHGTMEQRNQILADIRKAEAEVGWPVGVLVDLAGPKIRLGELFQDPTTCPPGAEFRFIKGDKPAAADEFTCTYTTLVSELQLGDTVMLADGTVSMVVVGKSADEVKCRVVGGGILRSRQGINLPGTKLSVASLTEADMTNAIWAAKNDIDFVSLSFVRSPVNVLLLKELLKAQGCNAMVIAKIEKREAMDQLTEVVAAADGVMVARGDLGVEIDVAEIAVSQKRIVRECQLQGKPVIVATQMLDSMHHNRRPTRAEATDVANAILDGADACMLSGETAIGEFPVEAVQMMSRIMLATEPLLWDKSYRTSEIQINATDVHPITAAAVRGSAVIVEQLGAKLLVVVTRGGGTCRIRSKQRDFVPTIGVSDSKSVLRRLSLYWGVTAIENAPVHDGPALRAYIDAWGRSQGIIQKGDRIVFVTGTNFYPMAQNLLVVHEAE
ncbi:pyruvate kinase [Pirellula staleyi DSM 6068]|uniref:Pyruvate kinase n=1 Tax=Pirellula staleyi (strain ATCC 27377 / DSM 6068 / ICPB 4128) TaxID=530564 RepID=D2R555_PIRSD|nr:pyruvate kinase [Pirellula staleyi]ADB19017.1 pyruvate kinase [Pirellula staleyi DSM 6068]